MGRKSSSPKSSSPPSKRHRGGSVEPSSSSSSQPYYVSSKPQRPCSTPVVGNQSSTSTRRRRSEESIIGAAQDDDILLDHSYGHVVPDSDNHSNQPNLLPSVTPTNVQQQQQQQHVFTNSTVISEFLEESSPQGHNINNEDDEIQIIPIPNIQYHPDCPVCNPNIIRNNFDLVPLPPRVNPENVNIPQFNTDNPNNNNGNINIHQANTNNPNRNNNGHINIPQANTNNNPNRNNNRNMNNNTENDLSMEITGCYHSIFTNIHGIGLILKRRPEIHNSSIIILRQLLHVVSEAHGKLLLPEYLDVPAPIPPISSNSNITTST